MTEEVLRSLQTWFERYVSRFRDGHGALHPALELKYRHALRVAENARIIARGLGLSSAEVRLANGCGLMHDVGRFTQFVEYGSFRDADTVDHGAEGRRVLEAEGLRSLVDPNEWTSLATAVEYHNRRAALPSSGLGRLADLMLRLTRDADKLDIMGLVLQSIARDGFQELPEMLPHIRLSRAVTPAVLAEASKKRSVSIKNLVTLGDFLLMLSSWFYDFNYPPTQQLAMRRDLLGRIQRELPDTQAFRDLLASVQVHLGTGT